MAFGTQDSADEVMHEINMTPLVDVMLVLLIIFIITVPVMKHSVNVDLPRATSVREQLKPQIVRLSVDAAGSYYVNENRVADEALLALLRAEASKTHSPNCISVATEMCVMNGWPRPWRSPSRLV